MTANTTRAWTGTDRIEKRVTLKAPRSRVWNALTRAEQFNAWFRINLEGPFAEGATVRGRLTHKGYERVTVEFFVVRLDPERYFAYRWHPGAVDPERDYSAEPTTLVEFLLEEVADGTALTIIESGFDRIPDARRTEAFRMNEPGWNGQIRNLEQYVTS